MDVQFRLLREDYLKPLREGIFEFREIIQKERVNVNMASLNHHTLDINIKKKLKSIDSLSIYFGTQLVSTKLTDIGIVYQLRLGDEQIRNGFDLALSKKLIFGSMVCLSSDYFMNNCLIGIICDRDIRDLRQGIIGVRFRYDSIYRRNSENFPAFNNSYTMLETSAFFESYKHVLESLVSFQHLGDEAFPFKKHIVDCQNEEIEKPEYLKNACLDLRFVFRIRSYLV